MQPFTLSSWLSSRSVWADGPTLNSHAAVLLVAAQTAAIRSWSGANLMAHAAPIRGWSGAGLMAPVQAVQGLLSL